MEAEPQVDAVNWMHGCIALLHSWHHICGCCYLCSCLYNCAALCCCAFAVTATDVWPVFRRMMSTVEVCLSAICGPYMPSGRIATPCGLRLGGKGLRQGTFILLWGMAWRHAATTSVVSANSVSCASCGCLWHSESLLCSMPCETMCACWSMELPC
jgi:hypothetical protein